MAVKKTAKKKPVKKKAPASKTASSGISEAEVKKWIRLVEESQIAELEVSLTDKRIRITKQAGPAPVPPPPVAAAPVPAPAHSAAVPAAEEAPVPAGPTAGQTEIKAPMVGTFYAAGSPDAAPFVKAGDTITKGQPLCIIEAMKVMNEIESEHDGKVVKVLVKNGQPVEFNQPLFIIE